MFAQKLLIAPPFFLRVLLNQGRNQSSSKFRSDEIGVGESCKILKLILTSNFESSQVTGRSGRYRYEGKPIREDDYLFVEWHQLHDSVTFKSNGVS